MLVDEPGAASRIVETAREGRVRLALDGISGEATARLAEYLSPGGTLVGYALMSGNPMASVKMLDLMWRDISLRGFSLGHSKYDSKLSAALDEAARLIASRRLHVPVAAVYPLARIKEAAAHVDRGGKVLLDIAALA